MKGQMEMMGLIMLVVLGGLIFLFAVAYGLSGDTTAQDTYRQEELSNRFVTTLAGTHIPRCDTTYETLVKDCANDGAVTCNGATSCKVINDTAEEIVNRTVKEWGRRYRLQVTDGNDVLVNETRNCRDTAERAPPGIYRVPLNPSWRKAKIRLDICI